MTLRVIRFGSALLFSAPGLCHADCAAMYALAHQHAYDMARRNSLDHADFMRHRANMMRGGCQAIASAVSASGRRYWVMEIGGGGGGGTGRDFSVEAYTAGHKINLCLAGDVADPAAPPVWRLEIDA